MIDENGDTLDISREERTVPMIAALAMGVLLGMWGLFSIGWSSITLFSLLLTGGLMIFQAFNSEPEIALFVVIYLYQGVWEVVGLVCWVVLTYFAWLPLRAAMVLNSGGPWEHVVVGAKAAVFLPIAWFVIGVVTAIGGLDCLGLFLGNLPTVALEALGLITYLLLTKLHQPATD